MPSRRLVTALVVLIVGMLGVGVVTAVRRTDDTTAAAPGPTPSASQEPTQTPTPEPTDTGVPTPTPTGSFDPNAQPTPTPTPTGTGTGSTGGTAIGQPPVTPNTGGALVVPLAALVLVGAGLTTRQLLARG